MVLGRASDDDPFQRHVGVATARPAWRDLQNRLAADTKAPALDGRSGSRTTGRRRRSRSGRNCLSRRRYILRTRKRRQNPRHRGCRNHRARHEHAKYLDTRSGRIRLAMISDNSSASIEAFVNANVKRGATLLTDGHKSYPGLTGYRHDPRVVGKMAAHIVLPWIHRAFSLMRRWSLGTYHGLRRKHVDTYLNEFVFRYNRRFYRHVSFETLLGLAADKEPASYWDIIKRDNPRKSASRAGSTPPLHIGEPESAG